MIIVKYTDSMIAVQGHANYAPPGQDIVCAAISSLALTLIASLEDLTQGLKSPAVVESGNIIIEYKNGQEDTELLVRSFILGCDMIANTYPKYIKVESEDL